MLIPICRVQHAPLSCPSCRLMLYMLVERSNLLCGSIPLATENTLTSTDPPLGLAPAPTGSAENSSSSESRRRRATEDHSVESMHTVPRELLLEALNTSDAQATIQEANYTLTSKQANTRKKRYPA